MKKSLLLLTITPLLLVACGDKDAAYYEAHPDKAEEKLKSCMVELMSGNKDKLKDTECKAADDGLRMKRQKEREAKEAARKAEEDKLLVSARQAFSEKYGKLSPAEYISAYNQSECSNHVYFKLTEENASCWVMKENYQATVEKLKAEYSAIPFDESLKKGEALCKLNASQNSVCDIWQDSLKQSAENSFSKLDYFALNAKRAEYCDSNSKFQYRICNAFDSVYDKKQDEEVKKYVNDDALFTKAYNDCRQKAQNEEGYNDAGRGIKLTEKDPTCEVVSFATRKRGLYSKAYFQEEL